MKRRTGQHDRPKGSNKNSRVAYALDDFAPESLDMAFDQMDFNLQHDDPFDHHGAVDGLSGIGAGPACGAPRSQAQGQGEQSQNQSQIMQQNLSGFGMFPGDEPSSILELQSSHRQDGNYAPHQQQMFFQQQQQPYQVAPPQHHQQLFARTNEQAKTISQVPHESAFAEVQALKHLLGQLSHELSNTQPQVHGMIQAAMQHATTLNESLAQEARSRQDWKFTFKEKVRIKLNEFKEQKKKELGRAEKIKFKQQINEFELKDRVSTLEQANRHHKEEINRQANANEILKFEKMRLLREQGKRLKQIESALGRIQIQKSETFPDLNQEQKSLANEQQLQMRHRRTTAGSFNADMGDGEAADKLNQDGCKSRLSPFDSQNDKKRKVGDELSRSLYIKKRNDQLDDPNQLALKTPLVSKDCPEAGLSTQILNLQELVQEFQHQSEKQQKEEVKLNDYQGSQPNDEEEIVTQGCEKQPSLSDLDFHPQQKLMNNFFSGAAKEDDGVQKNGLTNSKLKKVSSDDVNRAVIMPDGGATTEEDRETVLGDLAQQLDDTSCFIGPNNDSVANDLIDLPANLNHFKRRSEDGSFPNMDCHLSSGNASASLLDEEHLLNTSDALDTRRRRKKRAQQNNGVQDSDDKAVEDLFKDTSSSDSAADKLGLERFNRQLDNDDKNKRDVDFDDLMQASVDTDIHALEDKKLATKSKNLNKNLFDEDLQSPGLLMDNNCSKLHQQMMQKDQIQKEHDANLSLALDDLSAIVSEGQADKSAAHGDIQVMPDTVSEDDNNLAGLNRQLMPHFVVNIGPDRWIKMPRLDIERVLGLFQEKPFEGNLPAKTGDSLQTDTILDTHKALMLGGDGDGGQQTQTSGGSFLNETGSKQQVESQKSKNQQQKTETSVLDYLNKCDDAISAIIDDAALDADVEVPDIACVITEPAASSQRQQPSVAVNSFNKSDNNDNMLDSLREEIFKEEQQQQKKCKGTENQDRVAPPSPAPNSMPFELRDSIPSKFTDSNNQMLQSSVMCYTANDKRSLSQAGQKIRQSSTNSAEAGHNNFAGSNYQVQQSAQTHLRLIQKNDLTLSQKDFDKKSQMRLSELDSVSGGGGQRKDIPQEQVEGEMVPRTQKIGKIPAMRKIKAGESSSNSGHQLQARHRLSSENQHSTLITNGTDSISGSQQTGSLQNQSLQGGQKSRMSAPVTIPTVNKTNMSKGQAAYTAEVVNEVDDDDSKILSVNNSSNQINEGAQEQSIEMLAYNSAYPHSTKNTRYAAAKVSKAKDKSTSGSEAAQQQSKKAANKVSIQRVQHHADEMSSLIRNQQKSSSSIQRLKIVKKASVNSGTAQQIQPQSQPKRDVLTSNSVERPSDGGNSSISLIEQSRITKVNISAINKDYASASVDESGHKQVSQQESSNPRLSINTRKSKPITVSFKNIVKAGIQKRKTSTAAETENARDDSEQKRSSIVTDGKRKPGSRINVKGSGGSGETGKSLNITVLRNGSNSKSKASASSKQPENAKIVKQVFKISNPNSSVEEMRDGSVIFMGNRKNTVERVRSKRETSKNDSEVATAGDKPQRPTQSKQKTKMLIAAHQIKQRKLSIGSAHAAASILPQQNLYESSKRGTNCLVMGGSRVQTDASKITSPESPRRMSSKSIGIKIQNHNGSQRDSKATNSAALKKGNIISLKRRDAAAPSTEFSQNMSSSKGTLANIVRIQGERNASVGTEGNQSSKRSQQTSDAPKLNIKRMTKSKNGRAKSTRPNTVIKQDSSQHHLSMVNQTAIVGGQSGDQTQMRHESFLLRDFQTNQSNTVLGDMSLLSKIGAESKSHLMAAHYGTTAAGQNGSILINQSSQQNLQQHISHEALGVKSAGKRIGLSRASIETSSSVHQAQANQSQVLNAPPSSFVPGAKDSSAGSGTMQISQKAMKIISSQKSKINGAQRQVQMEWKSSGVQYANSSGLNVSKPRHSAASYTTSD